MLLKAKSSSEAVELAKKIGVEGQLKNVNTDNSICFLEFIGICGIQKLIWKFKENNEVWYELYEKIRPMENASKLIKSDDVLLRSLAVDD